MKQHEAVIRAMEANGGYATLNYLYQNALRIEGCIWKTKTPQASIRRIVQENPQIFRIRPGLWALKSHRDAVLERFGLEGRNRRQQDTFTHSFYQGLLVEIGNLFKYWTYVPPQDKNKLFLDRPLKSLVTVSDIFPFTYPGVVANARSVDVIWFNNRKLPHSLFEIEHSTDIQNSFVKFVELQDFHTQFYIAADESRRREFESKISKSSFKDIAHRVKFMGYDAIANLHGKIHSLFQSGQGTGLLPGL